MSIDESTLRQALTTVFPSDEPRDDCPTTEHIWEGAHDELPPAQMRDLVQHLAACPLCTEAWLIAEAMEEPLKEDNGKKPRAGSEDSGTRLNESLPRSRRTPVHDRHRGSSGLQR